MFAISPDSSWQNLSWSLILDARVLSLHINPLEDIALAALVAL